MLGVLKVHHSFFQLFINIAEELQDVNFFPPDLLHPASSIYVCVHACALTHTHKHTHTLFNLAECFHGEERLR